MEVNKKVVELALDDVLPNRFQPRIKFNEDSLNELAESIKEHGVIQPIVVRPVGDKYEIIAGERRYKASVVAGKQTIPAIVTDLNDKDSAEVALIENVQRQNLTPIEEAISYKKILDMGYLNQTTLAEKLGKNQSTIANKLRLLELADEVQEALLNSEISERHARSLLRIQDKNTQVSMLNRIIKERMTVRKTDEEIDKVLNGNNDLNNNMNNTMGNFGMNTNVNPIPDTIQQPIPDINYAQQGQMANPNVQGPTSFESLFSDNPVNPIPQNNVVDESPVINENPFAVEQPIESIEFDQQVNPGFVNVDEIVNVAQPIMQNEQPVNMDNLVSQYNPNVQPSVEPTIQVSDNMQQDIQPEQELQPKKFFNILGEAEQPEQQVAQQPNTNVFNFDNLFQDVPAQMPNTTQQNVEPAIQQVQNTVPEQPQVTPTVNPFEQQQFTVPNPMPEEVSQPVNNKFAAAINVINECATKLQQLGYKQEHDDFDLGDMYQVIFRVE